MTIGLADARRTILLIDGDAHGRASLRNALEGEGFKVGEAATGDEGARTAKRIVPDAILVDLMAELIGSDHTTADMLADLGRRIPTYVIGTAAHVLVGAVGLNDLGISGVFLKPTDPSIIIQALKTRLGLQ